ncbi:unnamed protein product [Protopolystoma xenopodis]|uniref:Uncharacterized protein n=1 Tax=Protopolystoma xenopodis TaxID=117903 RepID=A0A448X1W8_9PLAT|nr:unnamed protein product [Protopolystoma xenopodis]
MTCTLSHWGSMVCDDLLEPRFNGILNLYGFTEQVPHSLSFLSPLFNSSFVSPRALSWRHGNTPIFRLCGLTAFFLTGAVSSVARFFAIDTGATAITTPAFWFNQARGTWSRSLRYETSLMCVPISTSTAATWARTQIPGHTRQRYDAVVIPVSTIAPSPVYVTTLLTHLCPFVYSGHRILTVPSPICPNDRASPGAPSEANFAYYRHDECGCIELKFVFKKIV